MDATHAAVSRRQLILAGLAVLVLAGIMAYKHAAFEQHAAISSFEECVAAGNPVMESFPRQCNDGTQTFVERVEDVETISASGNVRITSPMPGSALALPFTATGEARAFENTINWRLVDADESVLVEGFATADARGPGQFGGFSFSSSYPEPRGDRGRLEIFTISARDGSEQDLAWVPVTFAAQETRTIQAYFGNAQRDPDTMRCEESYPVTRRIAQTDTPARAALEELFQGPTAVERAGGSITSIPDNVRILSLAIADGVARVDLSRELRAAASGSCRVTAIRSQIESTLRQFDTVRSVTILIEGQADALEP